MPSPEPVSNGSRFCSWIRRQETTTEGLFVVSGVLGKEMAVSGVHAPEITVFKPAIRNLSQHRLLMKKLGRETCWTLEVEMRCC